MPKSIQEIINHANELAARFEAYEPHERDYRDWQTLLGLREAALERQNTIPETVPDTSLSVRGL